MNELQKIAVALHGYELEYGELWPTDNLTELATALREANQELEDRDRRREQAMKRLVEYVKTQRTMTGPKGTQAYIDMVQASYAMGITPMSPEEFAKEDKRLLSDWNRRRHGIDDAVYPKAPSFGIEPCVVSAPIERARPWWKRLLGVK